jgi:sugar lactone lactonase YvrE
MRERTRNTLRVSLLAVSVAATMAASTARVQAEDPNSAPNPYRLVADWAKLPPGRAWGMAIGVDIDRDGTSVWVFDRCGGKSCDGSNVAPIQKFDATGRFVVSFGSGLFSWPHGLFAAADGSVWVTDGKKQTVVQFAPDGQVLKTLGKPGVAGDGPDTFNSPSDVLVAPNGDIFVADGHGDYPVPKTNDRMVKFSKDGKFLKAWGRQGSAPGEFDVPHGLAMDSAGRLFVRAKKGWPNLLVQRSVTLSGTASPARGARGFSSPLSPATESGVSRDKARLREMVPNPRPRARSHET